MMNEHRDKARLQHALDTTLSGLSGDPWLKGRVLQSAKGEKPKMKRKMSLGLVLIIALALMAAVALATGLIFSPRYDTVRLANEALDKQYGITPTMMTVLYRADAVPDVSGNDVIIYRSVEDQWAEQIGVYTVTVRDGKAEATWSHDGEPISEGFSSPVWGEKQIALILSDYGAACEAVFAGKDEGAPDSMPSAEEIAENEQRMEENAATAKAMAKITLDEARALALEAITQVYGLTDSQRAALVTTDEEYDYYYTMMSGEPVVDICYRDADVQYWATVNLKTGMIEDVLYDSGLVGNG